MLKHIEIGGAMRPVKFTINALMEFEDLTGLDITVAEDRMTIGSLRNMRALTFVGLKHGHKKQSAVFPDFTIEDVGEWLDQDSMDKVMDAFSTQSKGGGEQQEEDLDKKKLNGETSGQ